MPTATTIPLILVILLLWRFTKGQTLSLVLFTSVFEAASALNFGGMGVSPWLFTLVTVLAVKVLRGHRPFHLIPGINVVALKLLLLFLIYAAWSGLVYPFLFHGATVLNSHYTSPVRLSWSMSNLSQLCYLMAAAVVYFCALGSSRQDLESALHWYVRGCVVASLFAFYQLANATHHVPFPSSILYSNPSHVIYPAYMINGMWRVNSTFPEASDMATYLAPGIALLGWEVLMRPFNVGRLLCLILMIASLILTVSTLGYLSLSFLLVAAPVLYGYHAFKKRALAPGTVMIALLFFGMGTCLFLTTNISATVTKVIKGVILDKTDSVSYRERAQSGQAALETASETYYMGAGWGSARASGLIYVLMGNVGIVGSFLFVAFIASLFVPMLHDNHACRGSASTYSYEKALLALMVILVGLIAAGAEPVAPILWALFAGATAGKPQPLQLLGAGYHRLNQLSAAISLNESNLL
jgi:hypothetical protein